MIQPPIRTLHSCDCHFGWDKAVAPAMIVAPGERVTIACRDAGDGQVNGDSTHDTMATLDPGRANPLTGPIHVDGARPGDALIITIEDFSPSGFGWTGLIPGFGLLADQFPDPRLQLWNYDTSGRTPLAFNGIAEIPFAPFIGTIGTAPATPGPHDVIPPRRVGGNMDIRDLRTGTVLYLPVEVEGALLSIGDTHAAQGDGEVCGTAIESGMEVRIKLELARGGAPRFPRYATSGPRPGDLERSGVVATTGIGPDLMTACRDAVADMIDHLSRSIAAEDAYMLCSVAADLRISEIVDAPNWVVSCVIPRSIFVDRASV
ncbi:acetamidase/formamidase family protein [Tropicimonas marinistellae]|uniref:acetamidase/formamidase family protein n=1 Tax=Tropicimonas marinistellae TaxID=1739787 RepID=UPI00082C5736|nr:acetamidase/formamidase family protein [Tropicimonas marinistellae]